MQRAEEGEKVFTWWDSAEIANGGNENWNKALETYPTLIDIVTKDVPEEMARIEKLLLQNYGVTTQEHPNLHKIYVGHSEKNGFYILSIGPYFNAKNPIPEAIDRFYYGLQRRRVGDRKETLSSVNKLRNKVTNAIGLETLENEDFEIVFKDELNTRGYKKGGANIIHRSPLTEEEIERIDREKPWFTKTELRFTNSGKAKIIRQYIESGSKFSNFLSEYGFNPQEVHREPEKYIDAINASWVDINRKRKRERFLARKAVRQEFGSQGKEAEDQMVNERAGLMPSEEYEAPVSIAHEAQISQQMHGIVPEKGEELGRLRRHLGGDHEDYKAAVEESGNETLQGAIADAASMIPNFGQSVPNIDINYTSKDLKAFRLENDKLTQIEMVELNQTGEIDGDSASELQDNQPGVDSPSEEIAEVEEKQVEIKKKPQKPGTRAAKV